MPTPSPHFHRPNCVVISLTWGLRRHIIDLLRQLGRTGGFTSLLRNAELFAPPPRSGPARGLGPCPASSSDYVINVEHINQLSRFHAQSFKILNFVWSDQALYFFGKKLFVKNFLVQTLFVAHKFKYPVYLGASFLKPFLLQMIILVRLHSLFMYYATICTMLT